jgi:hypothetical protein
MIDATLYLAVRARLAELGHGEDYTWSQNLKPPATPEALACEFTWVVLNSGMRNTTARKIMDRVWPQLVSGQRVIDVFRHVGKAGAITFVWGERNRLFDQFLAAEDVIAFCRGLPWIGDITKYHLAKNLGADVAKPDRWLVRLAAAEATTVDELCARLARDTGDRIATVDVVLWRACAIGVLSVQPHATGGWHITHAIEVDRP